VQEAVRAGIRLIHINTELRVAWRNAVSHVLGTMDHFAGFGYFDATNERFASFAFHIYFPA
jgi:fructose/tagatose bisphosphate aldolase